MSRRTNGLLWLLTLLLVAALIGLPIINGCGAGAGREVESSSPVEVRVTRDFGVRDIGQASTKKLASGETVMRLTQSNFKVKTAYGGGFVESIEGIEGGGGEQAWFYFVNGIGATTGAADRKVSAGDKIWWDRRDWSVAQRIPAVVGSFPEPFIRGTETKRVPLTIQCDTVERDCDLVQKRLQDAGVVGTARTANVGTGGGEGYLRVLIGEWTKIRQDPAAQLLEDGPRGSGVFARPAKDGKTLTLYGANGAESGTLGRGAGLIAATRFEDQQPTWVVTGTDTAGVAAAVNAFNESTLRDKFALAVDGGEAIPLPVKLTSDR